MSSGPGSTRPPSAPDAAPAGADAGPVSLAVVPQPARLEHEYRWVTWEALRPVSAGVAVIFALFFVFNWVDLPARAVRVVLIHDACMVASCAALSWTLNRRKIAVRWAYLLATTISLATISNVLLTTHLVGDPFYTFYVGVIIIAVGNFVLSTRWLLLNVLIICGAWVPITLPVVDEKTFVHFGFTLLASITVAATVHLARRRSHRRIVQLRQVDARMKQELERALEVAERARSSLDAKVEERTSELVKLHGELREELAERKRVERDRLELRSRLEHAQRVESVGRLASGVAHDFNNFLSVISGSIQFAQMHPETPAGVTKALDSALQSSERAADLTMQLLTYGRKQIMAPTVLDPGRLIDGIRPMLEKLVGKTISLRLDIAPEAGTIYADRAQLEQLMVNLTMNARDAMPDGGVVTIEASSRNVSSDVCRRHTGAVPGAYLCMAVADQGHGISDDTIETIFEPFFTTKEIGRGSGLGLAVVDGIVNQHGGFIEVSSVLGQGTTFEVYLPEVGAEAGPLSTDGRAPAPLQDNRGHETVALVEPSAPMRSSARTVLRVLGYSTLLAQDCQTMSQCAQEHTGEIHLLVMSARLSEADGARLVRVLRRERPRLRVLRAGQLWDDERAEVCLPEDYTAVDLAATVRKALDAEHWGTPKPESVKPRSD